MNKRNHPYFNRPIDGQMCTTERPVPQYSPKVLSMDNPEWRENINNISKFNYFSKQNVYNGNSGHFIDDEGYILESFGDDCYGGGTIAAYLFAIDEDSNVHSAPATIINTEDAGFRYVQYSESGKAIDLGPVDNTCMVGNFNRPEGLYVPLSNTKAMVDAAVILNNFIKEFTENDRDLPSYENKTDKLPF